MMRAVTDYFARLVGGIGRGWTGFWFTPSDASTLSAMRLAIGLVVVYLHATLGFDLVNFFGPDGLLPVDEIAPLEGQTFSYLKYVSTPAELWTVHLLGLAVLVLFAAGFWTRLTSILALLVFLSDINRAPMITSRTESVAAMLMCYLWIAPCGRRFSLDALLARRAEPAVSTIGGPAPSDGLFTTATIATRLIQIHLALLVGMMAFSQLSGEVWWMGAGMWWLIAREDSRLVDLSWLHASPKLIDLWTHAVVFFELCFPVLIWVPLARPLLLAAGVVVWTSLGLVTGEVTFAIAMIIASMAFVSPAIVGNCCGGTQPATPSA